MFEGFDGDQSWALSMGREQTPHSLVTTMSPSIGAGTLDIPDNLTIPQFFNASHVSRPSFSDDSLCFVEEHTGNTFSFADVSVHVLGQVTRHVDSRQPDSVSIPEPCKCHSFEVEYRYVTPLPSSHSPSPQLPLAPYGRSRDLIRM